MAELVTIQVRLDDNTPVSDVLAHVYSNSTAELVTTATSNVGGDIYVLLAPGDYNVRYYKAGFTVVVAYFTVKVNVSLAFRAKATRLVAGASANPHLCIASGSMLTASMDPYIQRIEFYPSFTSAVIDKCVIPNTTVTTKVDSKGIATIALLRGAVYTVNLDGRTHTVYVPDAPTVDIADLLYPRVSSVSFAEAAPYSVSVGSTLTLTPQVLLSSGVPLSVMDSTVIKWSIDCDSAELSNGQNELRVTGLKVGTVTLSASRVNETVVHIPDAPIQGVPIPINVTEV